MAQELHTALLTTVNAPYQTWLDGSALAAALTEGDITKGQVNSFFMETDAGAQKAFAKGYGVSEDTLIKTASAFAKWSGQKIALLA